MKKIFVLLSVLSIFLITSCDLFWGNEESDSGGSSYDDSGKEHFLVVINDSYDDVPISNIKSITGGRSANQEVPVVEVTPVYDGPKYVDVNINSFENIKRLEQSVNNNINYSVKQDSANPTISFSFTSDPAVGATMDFNCFDQTNSMQQINGNYNNPKSTFTLKANLTKCRVWLQNGDGAGISDSACVTLANTLNSLFDHEMAIFGSNEISNNSTYINTSNPLDKKLNVLIYDIEADGNSNEDKAYVGGLFYSGDFLNTTEQNACQCIHVDSYYLKDSPGFIKSTLSHEFQHMLNFINKYLKNNLDYETWFTEMLAMSAEDVFQIQMGIADKDSSKSRLSTFNAFFFDGFRNWRDGNDVLNSYANAYAFGAFLMRNYGGVKFIHEVATNNYVDEAAITAALHTCGFTNEDFYSVLHKFANSVVFPESNTLTLNKAVTENFSGVNYTLKAINLLNYGVLINANQKTYFYDYEHRVVTQNGKTYIFGPVIPKSNIRMNGNLGSAGMYVTYMGVQYSRPHISEMNGLTQYFIVK